MRSLTTFLSLSLIACAFGCKSSASSLKQNNSSVAEQAPEFDGRKWKVGYTAGNAQEAITEYVLSKEDVENWSELFTVHVFKNLHKLSTVTAMENVIRAGFQKDCPDIKWTILKSEQNNIVYEWSHGGCAGYPAQHEIGRLKVVAHDIYNIRYTKKTTQLDNALRSQWLAIVEQQ